MVALALIPPINFVMRAPSTYWPWWVAMAAFAGIYTLFIKTSFIVKFIAIAGFFNCFFSKAPYISFTGYMLLILCCYFFILCRSIKSYTIILNMLKCLLVFTAFMFIIQCFGGDRLFNIWRAFSRDGNYCFGVVGHRMQSASFSVILAAALMPCSAFVALFPLVVSVICNSAGAFLCASFGTIAYFYRYWSKKYKIILPGFLIIIFLAWMFISGKVLENTSINCGRMIVWINTLKMTLDHPFVGHGISTFKGLFPAYGGVISTPWLQTHNCWFQMIFEFGYIVTSVVYGYFLYLLFSLARLTRREIFRKKAFQCLAGLLMIAINMCIHFPTRMTNTTLIIIFFLAYTEGVINHGRIKH